LFVPVGNAFGCWRQYIGVEPPHRGPSDTGDGTIADPEAFERCFEEHFPPIYRFIARRVGTALADDLAAETFATAFRRRHHFDAVVGSPRSWLFGIAANVVRNHWRAEQHMLELDARLQAGSELQNDPALSEERLSASLVAPRIAASLSRLTGEQREVLLLHAWGDLSNEQIAAALGVPAGTVRSWLSRARAVLREELRGYDFGFRVFEEDSTRPCEGAGHG
jgi:RNA polymerase sigma factor (sigma-70 family)